jgi:diguanylate cyclase (GGDEF)-like protein/PAS domain S-box-containing protein
MDGEGEPGQGHRPYGRDRTEAVARLEAVTARLLDAPRVGFSAAIDRHRGFTAGVISRGEMHVVDTARTDPDIPAYIGAPVRTADGMILGALWATDPGPRSWDEDDRRLIVDMASAVASVMELSRTNRALAADLMRQSAQEDRFRESQQRVNLTFDHAPVAEAVVGLDGRWLECNAALCRLLGYSAEVLLRRNFEDVMHPDDVEDDLALLARLTGVDVPDGPVEKRFLRSDGDVVWVVLQVSIVRDVSGGPRYLIVQMEDVSERRRRSEELKAATEELTTTNRMLSASVRHAQASEARYRALVDRLPDTTVHVYDREHRIAVSVGTGIEGRGFDDADLVGRRPSDLLSPSDAAVLNPLIDRAFAGETTRTELRLERGDRDYLLETVPLDSGRDRPPDEVLVVSRDITDIKQRERQLARNEARWRAAFDAAPVGVAELTLEGGILRVNPAMCDLVGCLPADLEGTGLDDLFDPEDVPALTSGILQVTEDPSGKPTPSVARLVRPDGSVRWLSGRGAVIPDPAGQPSHLLLYLSDVTEDHEHRQRLEASRSRFAALVEHGADVIAILDADLMLRYVSPASRTLFGLSPARMVGSSMASSVHPEDVGRLREMYRSVVDDPDLVITFDARVHQPDGTWKTIESTVSNRLEDPAVMGLVCNCRDVTDRVEAAARLAYQAMHDPLTGLPNRALLLDRLDQAVARAKRSGHPCAVLYIDLDRFKQVNDNLGHEGGDRLLVAVAERLRGAVRPGDSVGRMGGDEFVLLADGITDINIVLDIAERVRHAVMLPIVLRGESVTIGCTIGIALADELEPDELLRRADQALYRAKAGGRNRWELYDQTTTPPFELERPG